MPSHPAPISTARTRQLIEQLQLQPHPEGGWYREVFRSPGQVMPQDGRPARSALTSIYFLLEAAQHSRWHRVLSDEVWVHLEGAPLDLWTWDATDGRLHHAPLGRVSAATTPQHVVAAGLWQAARPQANDAAGYTLVACMVGPGFDFPDFRMMEPGGSEARRVAADHPALAPFI
ncbi:cupin domain-containing protein [Polaromonas sp. YR568]|uniref:cupin domain-containing protein n=1 Tax=Polaromonas sp. YR568 TaxID=1855301 RepID=UPI00398C1FFE